MKIITGFLVGAAIGVVGIFLLLEVFRAGVIRGCQERLVSNCEVPGYGQAATLMLKGFE